MKKKLLEEYGFVSPAERAMGSFLLSFIFIMSLVFIGLLIVLLSKPFVLITISVILVPAIIIYFGNFV